MPGVLTYKATSPYDDAPGERYHFPKRYLGLVRRLVGDWVAFYEPYERGAGRRAYVSYARVVAVEPDPRRADHHYAVLADAGDFARPVPAPFEDNPVEGSLRNKVRSAVRRIDEAAFRRLIALGDAPLDAVPEDTGKESGLSEDQAAFDRPLEELVRAKRAAWFRERVLAAYDRRCALTGMRLVNGGGASEVEAAHIKPVAEGGPDLVSNGIALTRTVHWMFDRHLITFEDDGGLKRTPLLPRDAHAFLGNVTGLAMPARQADRPSPAPLAHHRARTRRKVEAELGR